MTSREWDSQSYHRLSNRQREWGRKVLARVKLRGDETVLDAGCGTGRVTAELAMRLPRGRVVGTDLSYNMLHGASESLKDLRAGRVDFVQADFQDLPFDSVFDGIVSTAAFHWAKDHERMFASLFRALKPGGWMEAQCGGGPNLARLRQRAHRVMSQPEYADYFRGWAEPWEFASPEVTTERMRRAGFADVETWLEPAGFKLDSPQEYRDYLATVTLHQHLSRIPQQDLRDRFLDTLITEAVADPEFELDYWRLNLRGRKARA